MLQKCKNVLQEPLLVKPFFYWVAAFWFIGAGEDDRTLSYGFPLQFLQSYVHVTTTQNLWYCFFFKEKHREDTDLPVELF